MDDSKDRRTLIIKSQDAPDITVELANYLEVLGSLVRLRILKIIEKEPMDTESISHQLYLLGIRSCRENTEKHLKKLLSIGLVRKEPAEKNGRPVMNYVLVTGAIETAIRTIKQVLKLDLSFDLKQEATKIHENLTEGFCLATVKVLGGIDDGKQFRLTKKVVRIGRVDPENLDKYDAENDIVLSDHYIVVSRAWKPQALLSFEDGEWYIQQGEGTNPTSLWDKKLAKGRKEKLKHEDIIHLAEGDKSARLLFLLPKCQDKSLD